MKTGVHERKPTNANSTQKAPWPGFDPATFLMRGNSSIKCANKILDAPHKAETKIMHYQKNTKKDNFCSLETDFHPKRSWLDDTLHLRHTFCRKTELNRQSECLHLSVTVTSTPYFSRVPLCVQNDSIVASAASGRPYFIASFLSVSTSDLLILTGGSLLRKHREAFSQ